MSGFTASGTHESIAVGVDFGVGPSETVFTLFKREGGELRVVATIYPDRKRWTARASLMGWLRYMTQTCMPSYRAVNWMMLIDRVAQPHLLPPFLRRYHARLRSEHRTAMQRRARQLKRLKARW